MEEEEEEEEVKEGEEMEEEEEDEEEEDVFDDEDVLEMEEELLSLSEVLLKTLLVTLLIMSMGCVCDLVIHGCVNISSSLILFSCLIHRHRDIRSFTSCDSLSSGLQYRSALLIWASVSKGMSPHTMSYSRIPRDQTVRPSPR